MKRFFGIVFFLTLVNLGCSAYKSEHITTFLKENPEDVVLVDVRTPKEYNQGHLKNARNIDWFDDTFNDEFFKINKDKTIYVYCRTGNRSAKAQEKLRSLGYKKIINLEGGYEALKANTEVTSQ